jgi:hypothetical protein
MHGMLIELLVGKEDGGRHTCSPLLTYIG